MPIGFVLNTIDWWMDWHRGEICQVSIFVPHYLICIVDYVALPGQFIIMWFLWWSIRCLACKSILAWWHSEGGCTWKYQEGWTFSCCLAETCEVLRWTAWNRECWEWNACFLCCFNPFPGWNWPENAEVLLWPLTFSIAYIGDNRHRWIHAHPDHLWLCHIDWNLFAGFFYNNRTLWW